MKKYGRIIMTSIVLLGLVIAWLINIGIFSSNGDVVRQKTALERDGNECIAIAEKSVSHLVAVVEFQKLEIIGRKARIMRNCMSDHGYIQNPDWTQYATPIAMHNAKSQQVSFNEAFENLRREDMVIFTTKQQKPLFWMPMPHHSP